MSEENDVVDEDREFGLIELAQQRKRYKTPEEALQACLTLWSVILLDWCKTKEAAYVALRWPEDIAYCPCCEYDASVTTDYTKCESCPMWAQPETDHFPCLTPGSPYTAWTTRSDPRPMVIAIREVIKTGKKL